MKKYRITVNGKTYEVGVEECKGDAQAAVQPAVSVSRIEVPAAVPMAAMPKAAAAPQKASPARPAGSGDVTAPMPGTVISVAVSEGQQVKEGQLLVIFETMKMENELLAPCSGTVKKVCVSKGAVLGTGMLLVSIA